MNKKANKIWMKACKEHCDKKENSSIFNEMIKYVHGKNPIELKEHCDKGERK
jgi:hypothetical protein